MRLLAELLTLISLSASGLFWQGTPSGTSSTQAPDETKTAEIEMYSDADAYQIYAALLKSERHSALVIRAEIRGDPNLTAKKIGIKGDSDFMKTWGPVMRDYAAKNRENWLLTKSIATELPYELLPEAEINQFFQSGPDEGWQAFYQKYPSSGGYYWFSAVGFDAKHARAIVEMNHMCGSLCGGGGPAFFEKKGSLWIEVRPKAEVMAWFS